LIVVSSYGHKSENKEPPILCFDRSLDFIFSLGSPLEEIDSPKKIEKAISADDGTLMTITKDGTITHWDLDTKQPSDEFTIPPFNGYIYVFKVISSLLIISSSRGDLFIYQLGDDGNRKLCHKVLDSVVCDAVANGENIFLMLEVDKGDDKDKEEGIEKAHLDGSDRSNQSLAVERQDDISTTTCSTGDSEAVAPKPDVNGNHLEVFAPVDQTGKATLKIEESKKEENTLASEGASDQSQSDTDSDHEMDQDRMSNQIDESYHNFSRMLYLVTFSRESFEETNRVSLKPWGSMNFALLDDRYVLMNEDTFVRIYDSETRTLLKCKIESPQGRRYMHSEIDRICVLMNHLILVEVTMYDVNPEESKEIFVIKKEALLAVIKNDTGFFCSWPNWREFCFLAIMFTPEDEEDDEERPDITCIGLSTISSNVINLSKDEYEGSVYCHDDSIFMVKKRGEKLLLHAHYGIKQFKGCLI